MKRLGKLMTKVCAFDNLLLASRKAQKGKRDRPEVARFNLRLESELFRLQEALSEGSWQPGPYHAFEIYDPKRRLISAAPYRDRVVHHAICNVIEPVFEPSFIHDSYANRKGKGVHRAVDRLTDFLRRSRFVLKADIRKYFPSIDHEILKGELRQKIKDQGLLQLLDRLIDGSNPQEPAKDYFPGDSLFTPFERRQGIPIGNLTSQFFANVYLNRFDHFVKRELGCTRYIRYVDDFVLLDNEKGALQDDVLRIGERLQGLRLRLHMSKCQVFPIEQGVPFLGYRVFRTHRRLRRDNVRRFQRRARRLTEAYRSGRVDVDRVGRSVRSWVAHASHANTYGLRRKLLGEMVLTRG